MPIRFQVDADFYDHPKTIDMSDAATALWARAGSYSAAKLTDGFVPDAMLVRLSRSPEEASGELVRRGLWKRVRGGFKFHQWGERNLTRERVEADRKADRDRKRAQRRTNDLASRDQREANERPSGDLRDSAEAQTNVPRSNRNGQVDPQVVPPGIHTGIQAESDRIPNDSVSVSVSVSESVSGSGRGSPPPATAAPDPPPEPPSQCPNHTGNPNPPPCGGCADARRAWSRWDADRRQRLANAPKCRQHRGQLAHNCALCRSEQLARPHLAAVPDA